jgi:SAM-dependent methyltransferase
VTEQTRLPVPDPKRVVKEGYDRIAERYLQWASRTGVEVQARYLGLVLDALPAGAPVLDLGCGAGGTTTRTLAGRFRLTGVDISGRSIALARRNVPQGRFLRADMTRLTMPPATFDAVVAFYSIIHVPRSEHAALLANVATWLRPGGLFVASFGTHDSETGYEDDWLGTAMYWSGYEPDVELRIVEAAGLSIDRAAIETIDEDGQPASFLWVVAHACGSARHNQATHVVL